MDLSGTGTVNLIGTTKLEQLVELLLTGNNILNNGSFS